ncbi:MAG: hypothetical protein AVDCRST_MAG68-1959, partial [uncultured Gemmatimonadetes bacterium]
AVHRPQHRRCRRRVPSHRHARVRHRRRPPVGGADAGRRRADYRHGDRAARGGVRRHLCHRRMLARRVPGAQPSHAPRADPGRSRPRLQRDGGRRGLGPAARVVHPPQPRPGDALRLDRRPPPGAAAAAGARPGAV